MDDMSDTNHNAENIGTNQPKEGTMNIDPPNEYIPPTVGELVVTLIVGVRDEAEEQVCVAGSRYETVPCAMTKRIYQDACDRYDLIEGLCGEVIDLGFDEINNITKHYALARVSGSVTGIYLTESTYAWLENLEPAYGSGGEMLSDVLDQLQSDSERIGDELIPESQAAAVLAVKVDDLSTLADYSVITTTEFTDVRSVVCDEALFRAALDDTNWRGLLA